MKSSVKNVITAAGAAAAAGAAVFIHGAVSEMIISEVLDRDEPLLRLRNGSEDADGRRAREYRETHRDKLLAREHEEVSITAGDGTRLVGHLYRVPNPKRVVIAMHGWRSEWGLDFGMSADLWRDTSCTALYVEQRGQGESGGEYMGFGLTERYDCVEWARYILGSDMGALPVYLVGISMGATAVLMSTGLASMPENVHGVIADCAFTSPRAIWRHVTERRFHLPYGIRRIELDRLCRERINTNPGYSAAEALANSKLPVLFIHGTADTLVPVSMTYENYEACRSPKHLFLVPGAEHGQSYARDGEGYTRAVKEFFALYDKAKVDTH